MAQIHYISTTTIRPTSPRDQSTHKKIELTPWDLRLLQINYIQKGILVNKPAEPEKCNMIQHLQATLSQALTIFYPLAGRLAVTENEDGTTSVSINCNGEGAHFVHAVADGVKVADILGPVHIPDHIIYNLFSMNEDQNFEGISKPLLTVQVTELVNGIFISCCINHAVSDGTSFWHFFNTWSEISRIGSDKISQPQPVFDRLDLPIRLPFSYNGIKGEHVIEPSTDPLKRVVFHFPKEKVAELKSKANTEMGSTNISSLQSVLAHIWRAATRGRHLSPDQQVFYRVPVGLRQILNPPLPKEYLGNAILGGVAKSTAGELLQHGLGWAALLINKAIASMTAEEVRKYLEDWVKSPTIIANARNMTSVVILFTASSPRFNVYGNDFGWGRPLAVRSGPVERKNGMLTVFPGAEEGSIDVETCLMPEILQAMADDAEFMEVLLP